MVNNLSSRIDRDRVFMVSRDKVASVAHALLHGANHEQPAELTAGAAALFFVIAERAGMGPEELYHLGRRLVTPSPHHDKPNAQMEALRDFAGLRVRNDPRI